jgi:hypothetical protein
MQIHSQCPPSNCSPPNSKFNEAICVCKNLGHWASDPSRPPHEGLAGHRVVLQNANKALSRPNQVCSWQEKILGLFDPALRDAEDLMLSLPYADIREKTDILATVLDQAHYEEVVGAATRNLPGARPSTKPSRGRRKLSVTVSGSEATDGALTPASPSVNRLASRGLPAQRCDSSRMTKAMYVMHP